MKEYHKRAYEARMKKMEKISKESIKQNISNPLSVIYDKLEKKGTVTFKDIQDEYVHIHNYIKTLDVSELSPPPRGSFDGVEYSPIKGE